ncbi:MAG: GspE/PulE family protein [Desulfomonilia bacterium]|mgnify:CR=1 FL=1|jgi:type IV pilus assembly protein PilB|uniref:Type II secretion system protein E n=1 Tax=anaerobic digester metagenome TaxID=1263854 RepID=A0A485M963_9ZZZZ|nr:GspE/PulE family protein [Pseudomonadota bacterium]HPD21840.1 GspE/PulE family protein [Deltaproteobacteria bacterium]HPX17901.1 GspE/PulE family protein [Deltaproteobacteria bacterium]HRS55936.1 GspE/PulE family protein [Desulfomonilia bacterium]HRV35638.1 GspE/PulE family protein [Desulfomonilia bacterium]
MEKKRIGDLLKDEGIITDQEIGLSLKEQRATGERVGDILLRLGLVTQTELAQAVAKQSGLEFLELRNYTPPKDALRSLPLAFAKDNALLPVAVEDSVLTVATNEPENSKVLDLASRIAKKKLALVIASASQIQRHIEKDYYLLEHPIEDEISEQLELARRNIHDVDTEKLTRLILMSAINSRATDIHITPTDRTSQIHYRIDGILYPFYTFPVEVHPRIISTIKVKAEMDISEQRKPQDGRLTFDFLNENYDMRVSTLRVSHGENMVLRILASTEELYNLKNLGIADDDLVTLKEILHKPFGMILVSGPTGSGKTTTLYASLRELNSIEKNIVTVEDPVEYQFPLIRQTQVNEKAGYVFASAVRAFLRQDPDVILIGEIRDADTATMGMRAAQTGHLVLSTVHANDAVGAIPRLKDLGIKDYMISSSLLCVIAQRLVRALCPYCKEPYPSGEEESRMFGIAPGTTIYAPKGCDQCIKTGYLGRMMIAEILPVTQEVERLISMGAHPFEIKDKAIEEGMYTLAQDAVRKVVAGKTSFQEARRVLR